MRVHRIPLLGVLAAALLCAGGCCKLVPWALAVDPSLTGTSDANGMLEPGEAVVVAPSWHKAVVSSGGSALFACSKSVTEEGTASSLTGPVAAEYVIGGETASYGTFGAIGANNFRVGITRKCADCYEIAVSVPETRPSSHWDATFGERLGGLLQSSVSASKTWTVHIGDSFTDVPRSQPFYKKIETLLHHGITSGCSPTEFCPGRVISRAQLAVFVAKAIAGSAANVPASGTVGDEPYDCSAGGVSLFTDVASTDMFCRHIHYVASKNVDTGCEPGRYCPGDALSRLQMSSFVARALVQPGGDEAVPLTYGPDPVTRLSYSCDAASPRTNFIDVPETDPFCKAVHYLWAKGIIGGCNPAEFCRDGDVTRDQMAKFLVNAFRLTLYGP